ncbi:MAG TPA: fatty acid desaturase [Magnetospirillaceae bacterium]|jgi:omega-6 fatty acid desaturase (delta-12 desaturase)
MTLGAASVSDRDVDAEPSLSERPTPVARESSAARSLWQLASTLAALGAIWAAMYWSLGISYGLVLALSIVAAGLIVRLFSIQHDCGHGSFFRWRLANAMAGRICSMATLTPFSNWRQHHLMHHLTWNNLDRRESGMDIYSACLTVDEYRLLSRRQRRLHRLVQHPVIALLLLPPLIFVALYRVPFDTPPSWHKERRSVWLTNGALIVVYAGLGYAVGFREMLLVHAPIIGLAAVLGVWMFSLQHRFRGATWMRGTAWSVRAASLNGSSFLKLPKIVQWFTGNLGFHHIHHLDSRIPNYRLEERHRGEDMIKATSILSIRDGLAAWRYALWDEAAGRMVRISDVAV